MFTVIGCVIALAVLIGGGFLYVRNWRDFGVSDHLNVVLLVVALASLVIAIAAYADAHSSGTEQLEALKAAREAIVKTGEQQQKALDQQQTTLDASKKALDGLLTTLDHARSVADKSLATAQREQAVLGQQLATMQSLKEVTEEQWERATEEPQVLVMTVSAMNNGVGSYSPIPSSAMLSAGFRGRLPSPISISIRNIGSGRWRRPKVFAVVDAPAKMECFVYRKYITNLQHPCDMANVDLPDLDVDPEKFDPQHLVGKSEDLNFWLYVTYPPTITQAVVHLVVSGDNLPVSIHAIQENILP